MGHSRWTAAARELARQFWGTDPGFTLVMTSLGALGAAFFRGGLVRKVITAYSGNSFPTYTPNPIFRQAYESGEVEVEHWSILTLSPAPGGGRPRPAGDGHRVARRLVDGRQRRLHRRRLAVRAARPARAARARRRAGPRGGGRPGRQPRVLRAVARRALGRLGGPAGRRGHGRAGGRRRRGARAPGPRSRRTASWPWSRRPTAPTRAGATRRVCPSAATARTSRTGARRPTRRPATSSTATSRSGCSGRRRTRSTSPGSGEQLHWLEGRSDPMSWKADADATPIVEDPEVTQWENAASLGAREVERVVDDGRGRRRAGRCRRGQPGRLGGGGPGPGGGAQRRADGRARAVGLPADAGRSVHLQPAGVPVDAVPVGRLVRPRDGHRRAGDDDRGLPGRGRGRPQRLPELDRAGGRALPGRLGRRQRRGQPGHGLRRRHAGPSRTAARDRGVRHLARADAWPAS